MIRWFIVVAVCTALAFAEGEENVSEMGWFHSKQVGRYVDDASSVDVFTVDATLRTFWIDEHFAGQKTVATVVGGFIGVSTKRYAGLSVRAKLYASSNLWGVNPPDRTMVNTTPYDDTEGFIYPAEAELDYRFDAFCLRAGRMRLQTPYADEDDIRMAPNTFEGAAASYENDYLALHLLALRRWAGFDSTDASGNQSGFKRFAPDSAGTVALGLVYAPEESVEYNLWGYSADRLFDLLYMEASGVHYFSGDLHLEWGVQAAQMQQRDASGIEGGVYGALGVMHYRNLYAGGAYNYASVSGGMTVTDGFGGGPYYTSLDESTIAGLSQLAPGDDASVYRVGGGADIAWWEHGEDEGLNLEAVYGRFELRGAAIGISESDLMLGLSLNESLRVDAVFAYFDIDHTPDPSYDDFRRYYIRLDYAL